MVLQYCRDYFNRKKIINKYQSGTNYFSTYAKSSGYDSGVGFPIYSSLLNKIGLFQKSVVRNYGLLSIKLKTKWPSNFVKLSQYLSYLLFCYGPIGLEVQEPGDPFSHFITLTGVILGIDCSKAQIIYADPWEGQMLVDSISDFATILFEGAEFSHKGYVFYERVPSPFNASFYRRYLIEHQNSDTMNQLKSNEKENELKDVKISI